MKYTEIEIEGMKELLKEKEEEIKKLRKENKKLKEELGKFIMGDKEKAEN